MITSECPSSQSDPGYSNQQLRGILDRIDDGFYAVDSNWHFTYVNQKAKMCWDREREDLIGRHIWEEFPETVGSKSYRELHRALRMQKTSRFETICPAYPRWIEMFIYPNENGLTVQFRDIAAKKKTQQQLRRSERRYRQLFHTAHEAIVISTPEEHIVDANPAAVQLLGFSKRELQQMYLPEFFADTDEFKQTARQLASRGEIREAEVCLQRKDGQEVICTLSSTAEQDSTGETVLFYSFLRDVTEERRQEAALRDSERKFRQLAEQSLLGVALIQDNVFRYVNPRAAELFGYEPGEMTGRLRRQDVVHPEDWPKVRQNVEAFYEHDEGIIRDQIRAVTKQGETIYVEVHARRISSSGRPAVLSHILDVTERRRLQHQLLRVQEEERRRLGQELHDSVASQMTGITLILSSFESRLKNGGQLMLEDIRTVKNLVREGEADTRRLSRGLHPASLEENTLKEALDDLAKSIDGRFPGRCVLTTEKLPEIDQQAALHLYRIVQEATTNAIRHANPDNVIIECRMDGEELILMVKDDGAGFDPEETGEGLGSSSMRYRAQLLGAQLSITSSLAEGTTVRCRIPIDAVSAR